MTTSSTLVLFDELWMDLYRLDECANVEEMTVRLSYHDMGTVDVIGDEPRLPELMLSESGSCFNVKTSWTRFRTFVKLIYDSRK